MSTLRKIANGLAHLAGANTAVEVDHRGCFPRRTRHAPLAVPFQVCELRPVVERQRAHVGHALEPADDRVAILDQPLRIALLDVGNLRIKLPQLFLGHFLQAGILGIASNQVEVVAVNESFGEYPFRQRMNLVEVVASEHAC